MKEMNIAKNKYPKNNFRKDYPTHAYKTKREWSRDVRKRWCKLRSNIKISSNSVRGGCAYYPEDVYKWIDQFEKMDELMRDYYKNA